jgi:hypothetical protein
VRRAVRLWIALLVPAAAFCEVDKSCPGTALEHPPKLLGNNDAFQNAVRAEAYTARVVFRLTITDTGEVQYPVITSPARLDSVKALKDRIREWRFCPLKAQFDIEVRPE